MKLYLKDNQQAQGIKSNQNVFLKQMMSQNNNQFMDPIPQNAVV